jgi:plastocyanin
MGYARGVMAIAPSAFGLGPIVAAAAAAVIVASCSSSTPTSATEAPHSLPATVMIMASGPDPKEMTIAAGERVTFMNHDNVPHAVAGGADPARRGCAEIDAVGVLTPGESRDTAVFAAAGTCDYHDPRAPSAAFTGRIVIR